MVFCILFFEQEISISIIKLYLSSFILKFLILVFKIWKYDVSNLISDVNVSLWTRVTKKYSWMGGV